MTSYHLFDFFILLFVIINSSFMFIPPLQISYSFSSWWSVAAHSWSPYCSSQYLSQYDAHYPNSVSIALGKSSCSTSNSVAASLLLWSNSSCYVQSSWSSYIPLNVSFLSFLLKFAHLHIYKIIWVCYFQLINFLFPAQFSWLSFLVAPNFMVNF